MRNSKGHIPSSLIVCGHNLWQIRKKRGTETLKMQLSLQKRQLPEIMKWQFGVLEKTRA